MAIATKINGNRLVALVTVTAGTPIPLISGPAPIRADRISIQMLSGGEGKGLVYDDVPPNTAAAGVAAASGTPWELAPATATGPGGTYDDRAEANGFIDLRNIAVDGSHSADTMKVSAHLLI